MERRLENLEQEFANLQEDSEVTRFGVNLLLDWAEDASIQTVPIHSRKEKDDTFWRNHLEILTAFSSPFYQKGGFFISKS